MSGDALRGGQVADAAGANIRTLRSCERRAGRTGLCGMLPLSPVLIAAGVMGTGASAVAGRLSAAAPVPAALAGEGGWFGRRHTSCARRISGQGGCGWEQTAGPLRITGNGRT